MIENSGNFVISFEREGSQTKEKLCFPFELLLLFLFATGNFKLFKIVPKHRNVLPSLQSGKCL